MKLLLALFLSLAICFKTAVAAKEAASPPPFFIQDPTDSLCLAGEEFKRCSLDTLFYVLGDPGQFQIHKRSSDGTVDEVDDGSCLVKKSCKDSDNGKDADLKLNKCSHCGAKRWNILGDTNTGYVFVSQEDGSDVKTCLKRNGTKVLTGPCDLETGSGYTAFMLQFASATDITSMSSPGARLVNAATDGDKKAIQKMLKDGIDINFRDWDQITALMPPAGSGNLDMVKFLVKEGVDIDASDKDGVTALMEAAIMGHVKVVEFLLSSGAKVDAEANSGVTALWLAASQGQTEVVTALLKHGADISHTRSDGITALMTACVGGHLDTVKVLLENGADPTASDGDGITALMNAAENGNLDVIKLLCEAAKGDSDMLNMMSKNGFTALIIAAAQGPASVVAYLLDAGADPNIVHENGVTALMYAASNDHVDVMNILINKGKVDIHAKHANGGTALLEACTSGAVEAIKLLVDNGAEFDFMDSDGVTPLMAVGSQAKSEAHRLILDALKTKYSGQALTDHINLFSYSGGSAVMFAAAAGNAEFAKELIDLGADVKAIARSTPEYREKIKQQIEDGTYTQNEPLIDGLTALSVAAQEGHMSTVELLLEQGVDVNVADDEGRTPLTLSIKGNYAEIATKLINAGADPNTTFIDEQKKEHNLLFDAIKVENTKFASALIENGADIYYKDEKDVTHLLQACHRGLVEIAKLLIEKHKKNGNAGFIDDASDDGISPLIAASSEGHLDVVTLLLDGGANVNAKDKDSTTSLMAASARGHLEIVEELLKKGASINEQNVDGHTALMFAYNGKNQVETLWERFNQYSSDSSAKDADDGGTGIIIREALDKHIALVDLLMKNGADPKLKDKEGHLAKDFDYSPDAENIEAGKDMKKEESREEL